VSAQNGNLKEHNTTLPTGPGLVASAAFVGFNITVRLCDLTGYLPRFYHDLVSNKSIEAQA
jgi:hypothetical protein